MYLKSARFDLTRIFGGAVIAIVALLSGLLAPRSLVVWAWLSIALGDGPHMFATYLRAFLDASAWPVHGRVLRASFVVFLFGPAAMALGHALDSQVPFVAFIALSAFAGVVHVMRQHTGFLALYSPSHVSPAARRLGHWYLLIALAVPYFWFLISHRTLGGLVPQRALTWGLLIAGLLTALPTIAFFATRRGTLANAYFLVVVALSALAYFVIARAEPLLPEATGMDQELLVVSMLATFMHQVQYVAIVGLFSRARSARGVNTGIAGRIVAAPLTTIGAYVVFVLLYLVITFACGIYPGSEPLRAIRVGPVSLCELALSLFWGIALQHYVVDTRIWRFGSDPELRADLRQARTASATIETAMP